MAAHADDVARQSGAVYDDYAVFTKFLEKLRQKTQGHEKNIANSIFVCSGFRLVQQINSAESTRGCTLPSGGLFWPKAR
jgi:hypothetical protein